MTDTNHMRRDFEAWFFDKYTPESNERISNAEYLNDTVQSAWLIWQAATKRAIALERERCAQVCETNQVAHSMRGGNTLVNWHVDTPGFHEGMTYAKAIRQGGA